MGAKSTGAIMKTFSKYPIYLGCTAARHKRIGIDAVINARGAQQWRNDDTQEEIEMRRDSRKIADHKRDRVRFYQFNSRHFQKRLPQLQHLLSSSEDRP